MVDEPPHMDLTTDGSSTAEAGYGPAEPVSPAEADQRVSEQKDIFDSHPELVAAGAFAGGFLAAQLLRRLGGE